MRMRMLTLWPVALQNMRFVRKVHMLMIAPEPFNELDAAASAKEDWARVTLSRARSKFVTSKTFGDSLFQFAYTWMHGASAENYVAFLEGLFKRMADPDEVRRVERIFYATACVMPVRCVS